MIRGYLYITFPMLLYFSFDSLWFKDFFILKHIAVHIAVFVPVADKKVPDAHTSGHRRKESAMKQGMVAALVGFALLLAFVMLVTIGLRDAGLI